MIYHCNNPECDNPIPEYWPSGRKRNKSEMALIVYCGQECRNNSKKGNRFRVGKGTPRDPINHEAANKFIYARVL